jgi:hypothetical protein
MTPAERRTLAALLFVLAALGTFAVGLTYGAEFSRVIDRARAGVAALLP